MRSSFASGERLVGPSLNSQFEPVKIVGRKGGSEDVAHLSIIASSFQFLGSPPNCKIVDKYVSLFNGPLRDTADLAKFQVSQMLDAKPNNRAYNQQHQAQGRSRGPEQK